mmetsp:Transcript_8704/g.29927  ORF Transcript_8704/g.29927 Transcript_8704/m.29927 type:complete len:268 (-) Transcript_8704:99-902(-)
MPNCCYKRLLPQKSAQLLGGVHREPVGVELLLWSGGGLVRHVPARRGLPGAEPVATALEGLPRLPSRHGVGPRRGLAKLLLRRFVKQGIREVGALDGRPVQVAQREHDPLEHSVGEVCVHEDAPVHQGVGHVSSREVYPGGNQLHHVCAAKVGVSELGESDIGLHEVREPEILSELLDDVDLDHIDASELFCGAAVELPAPLVLPFVELGVRRAARQQHGGQSHRRHGHLGLPHEASRPPVVVLGSPRDESSPFSRTNNDPYPRPRP